MISKHTMHVIYILRSVHGAFYRVCTLDGVWVYSPPCMGPGVNPCGRKWLRALQRAKISPQDMQLNAISCIFLPKFKLNTIKPGLSGHSKEDRLSLNAGQKYCRMLQKEHSARLSTFIKLQVVIKTRFCFCKSLYLLRQIVRMCVFAYT